MSNIKDPEFKRQWVAALRSGEYTQCTGALHRKPVDGDPGGHCCVGVALEVAAKMGLISLEWMDDDAGGTAMYYVAPDGARQYSMPSHLTNDKLLYHLMWMVIDKNGNMLYLSELNDAIKDGSGERGMTFAQIADLIEEYM